MLMCRRRIAQNKPASFWLGLLGAFVTACITMVFSFRDYSGSLATAFPVALLCTALFIGMSVIPAMAVVVFYRKKCRR